MTDHRAEAGAFHAAHRDRLVGSLTLYTGDADVAAEVVDEAMLRAFARWERVGRLDAPAGWVWHVAMNLARSRHRRDTVARRAWGALAGSARVAAEADGDEPGVDHDADSVRAAVAALPARQREALILRHYQELSAAEAAARMGISPGAVRSLTKRAVAELRAGLVPGRVPSDIAPEDLDG